MYHRYSLELGLAKNLLNILQSMLRSKGTMLADIIMLVVHITFLLLEYQQTELNNVRNVYAAVQCFLHKHQMLV